MNIREAGVLFGPAGAILDQGESPGFNDIFIDGVLQETPWFSDFSGDVTFVAGALQSLTVDDSDPNQVSSRYVFGAGTFTLTARWSDQFGNPAQGFYVAPLLELAIDIRCEEELSATSCSDVEGGSLGDAFISVGPGLFDDALASILHLKPQGGAFDFDIALDGITGAPSDNFRIGGSQRGEEDIEIPVEVPEPSILSLLLIAPLLRQRFSRGRRRHSERRDTPLT